MNPGGATVRYGSEVTPTNPRRPRATRDPDAYISNNLTGRAWAALADTQAKTRIAGANPNKSTLLIAVLGVAGGHMDELISALEGSE
jgi:hypothetical protein